MPPPATATATAPGCCWRTGPTSSCTGSRSTRWASAWCRSTTTCARPSCATCWNTASCAWPSACPAASTTCAPRPCPARMPVLLTPDHAGAVPAAPWPAPKADAPITRDSECALLYTSGTTGRPKGCVLSNDYFLLAGEWYATHRRPVHAARRRRADDHAAAADAHERDGLFRHGDGHDRRLPGAARPLPSRQLVGLGARIARHRRALPGRDAGDAAGRAALAAGPRARRALRLRRGRGPAPAGGVRRALRLPAARSLGHDRDRRRRGGHRQPRAAARGPKLLRPRRGRGAVAAGRRGRRRRGRRRAAASCGCARPAPIRSAASSANT